MESWRGQAAIVGVTIDNGNTGQHTGHISKFDRETINNHKNKDTKGQCIDQTQVVDELNIKVARFVRVAKLQWLPLRIDQIGTYMIS